MRRLFLGIIASALVAVSTAAPAGAQKAGEVESVSLPGGKTKLPFVWCPPGKQVLGDPARGEVREVPRGFSMAQTELTQDAFFSVLRQLDAATRDRWKARNARVDPAAYVELMEKTARDAFANREEARPRVIGNDYPIFGIGLHEAALWCAVLNARQDNRGPVVVTFRLPTEDEWEHACRGRLVVDSAEADDSKPAFDRAAQNFTYFNEWPTWNKLPELRRNKILADWQKKDSALTSRTIPWQQRTFLQLISGTSDQTEKDTKETLLGHLSAVLKVGLEFSHNFTDVYLNELQPVNLGGVNPWGIRHMHGNVAEWVLPRSNWEKNWEAIVGNTEEAKSVTVQTRGGHFRHGGAAVTGEEKWLAFTVGHSGPAIDYKYATEQIGNSGYPSYFAGMRLVMTREVNPTRWIARLRSEATQDPLPAVAGRQEWLGAVVSGLATLRALDKKEADKLENQISVVRSQYLTRAGDLTGAADALAGVKDATADDALYHEGLQVVLKGDASKK